MPENGKEGKKNRTSEKMVQKSYTPKPVTLQELFDTGKVREPSLKALRTRVADGIPIFLESRGRTYYYDEQLSAIRLAVGRLCKRPGVRWKDISSIMRNDSVFSHKEIVRRLNDGESDSVIINSLKARLLDLLVSETK